MILFATPPSSMAADGFRQSFEHQQHRGYLDRTDPAALDHPHKKRRTSYFSTLQQNASEYGAHGLLSQTSPSAGYAPAPFAHAVSAEPFYYDQGNTNIAHAAGYQHHQPQHQHQHQQDPQQHQHQSQTQPAASSAIYGLTDQSFSYPHQLSLITGSSEIPQSAWEPQTPIMFDSGMQLRMQTVPLLDNLANKILETLAGSDFHEVVITATQPERSAAGQAYSAQVALFDGDRKTYSRDQLFLDPQLLQPGQSSHANIRKINLATFASTLFAARDLPFSQLHDRCLDLFLPDRQPMTPAVASLLLELKTQAFMAALPSSVDPQRDLLEYFPMDLHVKLGRRYANGQPTQHDSDLVLRARQRNQELMEVRYDDMRTLYSRYQWLDLLRHLNECLRQQLHPAVSRQSSIATDYSNMMYTSSTTSPIPTQPPSAVAEAFPLYTDSASIMSQHTPSMMSPTIPTSMRERSQSSTARSDGAPMTVQYEKARATSASKATTPSRRVSAASQRKPWSQEEETALMEGLDRVRGPHWSQILALYGNGGRISEVLKERTQVQLKDKARNLKLFFLKSNLEVPTYLQGVTGELKTRAPAQAAKREKEERLRLEQLAHESRGTSMMDHS